MISIGDHQETLITGCLPRVIHDAFKGINLHQPQGGQFFFSEKKVPTFSTQKNKWNINPSEFSSCLFAIPFFLLWLNIRDAHVLPNLLPIHVKHFISRVCLLEDVGSPSFLGARKRPWSTYSSESGLSTSARLVEHVDFLRNIWWFQEFHWLANELFNQLSDWWTGISFTGLFVKTKQYKQKKHTFLRYPKGFFLCVLRPGFPTWSWSCMSACWWFQRLQLHAF